MLGRAEEKDEISVVAVLGADSKNVLLQDVKAILESGNSQHDLAEGRATRHE